MSTLCDYMDYSSLGSSVHGISQARMMEWVAIAVSRGSSWPRNWTWVSYISSTGRWVFYHCATGKSLLYYIRRSNWKTIYMCVCVCVCMIGWMLIFSIQKLNVSGLWLRGKREFIITSMSPCVQVAKGVLWGWRGCVWVPGDLDVRHCMQGRCCRHLEMILAWVCAVHWGWCPYMWPRVTQGTWQWWSREESSATAMAQTDSAGTRPQRVAGWS